MGSQIGLCAVLQGFQDLVHADFGLHRGGRLDARIGAVDDLVDGVLVEVVRRCDHHGGGEQFGGGRALRLVLRVQLSLALRIHVVRHFTLATHKSWSGVARVPCILVQILIAARLNRPGRLWDLRVIALMDYATWGLPIIIQGLYVG